MLDFLRVFPSHQSAYGTPGEPAWLVPQPNMEQFFRQRGVLPGRWMLEVNHYQMEFFNRHHESGPRVTMRAKQLLRTIGSNESFEFCLVEELDSFCFEQFRMVSAVHAEVCRNATEMNVHCGSGPHWLGLGGNLLWPTLFRESGIQFLNGLRNRLRSLRCQVRIGANEPLFGRRSPTSQTPSFAVAIAHLSSPQATA